MNSGGLTAPLLMKMPEQMPPRPRSWRRVREPRIAQWEAPRAFGSKPLLIALRAAWPPPRRTMTWTGIGSLGLARFRHDGVNSSQPFWRPVRQAHS